MQAGGEWGLREVSIEKIGLEKDPSGKQYLHTGEQRVTSQRKEKSKQRRNKTL